MLNTIILSDSPRSMPGGELEEAELLEMCDPTNRVTLLRDRLDSSLVAIWLPTIELWEVWYESV